MPAKSREIKAAPNRWFRFYAESLDDPKVQRLPAHLFKTWVNLLSMACASGGTIARDDVAFRLRLSEHDASTQIDELIGLGLLDITAGTKLEPHNWKARQFVSDTSNERVRKHRERKKKSECNVTCNEVETPPDTETESETEDSASAESPREVAQAAPPPPSVSDLKKLSDRLHEVAGPCLSSQAVAPGLAAMTWPQMWIDQGCDLERDIVPAIQAQVARGRRNISCWSYFTKPVAELRAKRLAGLPTVDVTASPFARKRLDMSRLTIVDSPPEAYQ